VGFDGTLGRQRQIVLVLMAHLLQGTTHQLGDG
jgi:hypothetical protein